jgi:hypothetical protein
MITGRKTMNIQHHVMRLMRCAVVIVAVWMCGPIASLHAAEPAKPPLKPVASPIRMIVTKESKRERVKEQLVEIDMRTGLPAKGSKPVTTGMYNVDSGSCYRIELANTSTKAYPNLKVVWTLHYTQPAKKPDWNNHMRDTKPKDVTRTGSQAVSLNLGSKSLVTTEVVAGEIKGYKIELYDGQNLLAVETKGMPGK